MGSFCSSTPEKNFVSIPKKTLEINSREDLQWSPGVFVQRNKQSFHSVYKLYGSPIGSGGYAEVWLCIHKRTADIRAVKILHKSGISDEDIKSGSVFLEVEILKTLDHPNILKVYEYFEDETDYFIVMEHIEGGDLFSKLESCGTFTERYAAKIMVYLLTGLSYLHSNQVVHRDIKPENLLITNGSNYNDLNVKIIDFNIATLKQKNKLNLVTGTTDYMAPEVFRGVYDEKCDIWSSGVILYVMVSGTFPFASANEVEAEKAIIKGKFSYPPEIFNKVSNQCKDLINKLLVKNPALRLSAKDALMHPWLNQVQLNCKKSQISKAIKRMSSISKSTKLKELFTTFMVQNLSKTDSYKKLEKIFYAIDSNRDGVISKEELVEQLSLEMPIEKAESEAMKMIQNLDSDGSGKIDYTEFLQAAIQQETLLTKENIKKTFMYFDKDGSNAIEKKEIVEWLSSGGIIPDSVISELMEEADTNGDGSIDLNEFESILISKLNLDD
jgi:calcium-dependent protein kinase